MGIPCSKAQEICSMLSVCLMAFVFAGNRVVRRVFFPPMSTNEHTRDIYTCIYT